MISVRMAQLSELDDAKDFIRKIFPDAFVHVQDEDTILLAEYKGEKVGFAHVIDQGERLVLQGIGVEERMRNRGVGTVLIESVVEIAAETDRPVFLKVKLMNPAVDLYSRYGFFMKKFGNTLVLVKRPCN